MNSKTIVNNEQKNDPKLTQGADGNIDPPVDELNSHSHSVVAPAAASSEVVKKESPKSATMSLFGIIAIAVGLYFGIPFIRDSLKSLTAEVSSLREGESKQSELSNDTDKAVATETQQADQPGNNAVQPTQETKSETLDKYVEEALRESVWADKKPLFQYVRSKVSKDKKKIRSSFTFEGNQYDVMFRFSEDFELYEADISEVKFKNFFSKNPAFELPQ